MKKWCDIDKMTTIVHKTDFQQVYFAYTSKGNWNCNESYVYQYPEY